MRTSNLAPQCEICSSATAFLRGPTKPTRSATPTMAAAMNTKTARIPFPSSAMIRVESTALRRLQLSLSLSAQQGGFASQYFKNEVKRS